MTFDVSSSAVQDTVYDKRVQNTRRVLAVLLVILFLLLLGISYFFLKVTKPVGEVVTPEDVGGMVWVRSIYGWGKTGPDQLEAPNDVAIAPDGLIWVTDQARSRVVGFNPDGSYAKMLDQGPRGSSEKALSFPNALAVDEDGLIYICDAPRDLVVVMTPDNEVVREIYVPKPASVAARGDRIVVGAQAGFVIMDKEGQPLSVVGTRGKGEDQFDTVRGVAIGADGTIFVVDQYNNRVSAYDRNGTRLWIRETGSPGNEKVIAGGGSQVTTTTAEARMQLPAKITIDGKGRLVIVDPFDFSLTVLDPADGQFVARYGQPGSAEGQFTYPSGVDYDPARDWFAVADTFNNRVQIVRLPDSGGSVLAPVTRGFSGPLRACALPLLLLLAALVVWMITRKRQRREDARSEPGAWDVAQL